MADPAYKYGERQQLIIKESKRIVKGPLERRLLNTHKQNIDQDGNIRRFVFGAKNPQIKNRTILLMGETGTGKTTLINVLANYVLGVEWNEKIRYEIVEGEEEMKADQTKSQTSKVTVYEIYGFEGVKVPFSLRIIDTPGYGDTKGEEVDKRIAENLCHLFKCQDGVHSIDAVGLVVKASQNRLTLNQRYIFDAVLSIFGQDIRNNIVALITFAGPADPCALAAIDKAGVPCSRDDENNPVHFKFDNLPLEQYSKGKEDDFDYTWKRGKNSMQAFFEYLNNLETRSLVMTSEVLVKRKELECLVQCLRDRIERAEALQSKIRQTQDVLLQHKQDIEDNKNFIYTTTEKQVIKVESDEDATCCEICKFTCHYPCTWVSKSRLNWCSAMKRKNCKTCPGKCFFKEHLKERKKYVLKDIVVKHTFDELKKKYEKASGEKVTLESLMKQHQDELNKTEMEKMEFISESFNNIISLSEISLRPESFSMLQHLDFLIERLRETKQQEKVQILEDLKKKAVEAHKFEGDEQSVLAKVKSFFGSSTKN